MLKRLLLATIIYTLWGTTQARGDDQLSQHISEAIAHNQQLRSQYAQESIELMGPFNALIAFENLGLVVGQYFKWRYPSFETRLFSNYDHTAQEELPQTQPLLLGIYQGETFIPSLRIQTLDKMSLSKQYGAMSLHFIKTLRYHYQLKIDSKDPVFQQALSEMILFGEMSLFGSSVLDRWVWPYQQKGSKVFLNDFPAI
jgi:hypothetical protein